MTKKEIGQKKMMDASVEEAIARVKSITMQEYGTIDEEDYDAIGKVLRFIQNKRNNLERRRCNIERQIKDGLSILGAHVPADIKDRYLKGFMPDLSEIRQDMQDFTDIYREIIDFLPEDQTSEEEDSDNE